MGALLLDGASVSGLQAVLAAEPEGAAAAVEENAPGAAQTDTAEPGISDIPMEAIPEAPEVPEPEAEIPAEPAAPVPESPTMSSEPEAEDLMEPVGASGSTSTVYFKAGEQVTGMWVPKSCSLQFYGEGSSGRGPLYSSNAATWNTYKTQAKEIVIGDGVTKVSDYAFRGFINVTEVKFASADLTAIGNYSFAGCTSLKTILFWSQSRNDYFCKKLASIGNGAFSGCSLLGNFNLPNSVTTLGSNVFDGCSSLTQVLIPYVEEIPACAFKDCTKLQEVICARKLKSIGNLAFYNNINLTRFNDNRSTSRDFEIPSGCAAIGAQAFSCQTDLGSPNNYVPACKRKIVVNGAFNESGDPAGEIGEYAFYLSDTKTGIMPGNEITIGEGVKRIGVEALSPHTVKGAKLKNIEVIDDWAFFGCQFEGPLTINRNVKRIGKRAFSCCAANGIIFDMEGDGSGSCLEEIDSNAFKGNIDGFFREVKKADRILCFPASLKRINEDAFAGLNKLESIRFEGNSQLEKIDDNAFYGCESLKEVSFGTAPKLRQIGYQAFYNCDLSGGIDLNISSLETIGEGAFYNTNIVGTLDLSKTKLKKIDDQTFYCDHPDAVNKKIGHWTDSITTVKLPNSVETIGNGAFQNRVNLEKVDFGSPGSLTIGDKAFGLDDTYKYDEGDGKEAEYEWGTLDNMSTHSGLKTLLNIDYDKITSIGDWAFASLRLTSFPLSSQIEHLGEGAFYKTAVRPTTVPAALKTIPSKCFSGSKTYAVRSITIPQDVEYIADDAFGMYSNGNECVLYAPNSMKQIGHITLHDVWNNDFWDGYVHRYCLSIPASIDSLDCLLFYYTPGGVFTSGKGDGWSKIIFRGTEDQWKQKTGGKSVEQYLADYKTAFKRKFGYSPVSGQIPEIILQTPEAPESGKCGTNLSWTYEPGGKTLTITGSGDMYDYTQGGAPWKGKDIEHIQFKTSGQSFTIGANAFSGMSDLNLTSPLSVPSGCTSVGEGAFKDAKIQQINFNMSGQNRPLRIGKNAFHGSELEDAQPVQGLPKKTVIGEEAFKNCKYITSFSFPEGVVIEAHAFDMQGEPSPKITSFNFPQGAEIEAHAFENCSYITSLTFSKDAMIGDYAFKGCTGLNSLTFPEDSIRTLQNYAFQGCTSLTSVKLPNVTEYVGGGIFMDCTGLTNADLGNLTYLARPRTWVPHWCFKGCTNLQTVKLSKDGRTQGVYINECAFEGCTELTKVDSSSEELYLPDPEGEEQHIIGEGAFRNSGIKKINALNVRMRARAFENCTALTEMYLAGLTEIPEGAFSGCTELEKLKVGDGLEKIGNEAFYHCEKLKCTGSEPYEAIYNKPNLESIGNYAFEGCKSMTKLRFPSSVHIGIRAFYNCTGLTQVLFDLPATKEGKTGVLENKAFTCEGKQENGTLNMGITRLAFNGSMKIGNSVFARCDKLSDLTLTGVTQIGNGAFSGCGALRDITIPATVESIGDNAFSSCWALKTPGDTSQKVGLTTVTLAPGANCTLGARAFADCPCLTTIERSEGFSEFGQYVFRGNLPNSDANQTPLTNFTIGSGIKTIRSYTFDGSKLTDIYYKGTLEQWKKININYVGNDALLKSVIHCTDGYYGYRIPCAEWISNSEQEIKWGKNELCWSLSTSGTFEIHGTGKMDVVAGDSNLGHEGDILPWWDYKDQIKVIIVGGEEGDDIEINSARFDGYGNLESVTLHLAPKSSTACFAGCTKLKTVTIDGGKDVSKYGTSTLEDGKWVWHGVGAFEGCTALTDVSIALSAASNDQTIDDCAFKGCTSLKNVSIADGLYQIGENAFNGCIVLKTIGIPHSVTTIGKGAFTGCGGDAGITITHQASSGVKDYVSKCSSAEIAKLTVIDEIEVKKASLDKGTITIDLSSGSAALGISDTTLLINTLRNLSEIDADYALAETDQEIRVDLDNSSPYPATERWWEADDICIRLASDKSSVIVPLEWDEELTYEHNPVTVSLYDWQEYSMVANNMEYFSKITITFPGAEETCTVSFNANGGTGTMADKKVKKDTWYTLPYCGFTAPEMKVFDSWDKGDPKQLIYITEDTELKAVWREHDHALDYFAAVEPNCREDGNLPYYLCSICGRYFSDSAGKNEIQPEDAVLESSEIYHRFGEWITVTEPKNGVKGKKKRICSVCGQWQEKDIPALDHVHTLSAIHPEVKATCTTSGNKAYYECTEDGCGYKFYDDKAKEEVNCDADLIIPVDINAHDWGSGTVITAPTCTADGEMKYICKRNPKHVRDRPHPRSGSRLG